MKLVLTLLISVFGSMAFSQAPNSFKYQATARNTQGELIVNKDVNLRISVIHDNPSGEVEYQELFSTTTNTLGLININIGEGNSSNDFTQINWSDGTFFIRVEMDVNGGSNYQDFGTSQLLSVPYALYANTAGASNYSFTPTSPSGYQNITPLTVKVGYGGVTDYTVPSGKLLYILNLYSEGGILTINGIRIAEGQFNIGDYVNSASTNVAIDLQVLSQPIIAGENDVFEVVGYNASFSFNGYLINR